MAAKKINFELIEEGHQAYEVLGLAREHHEELIEANIGLAWRKRQKPDTDGHLVLGKCVKVTDLQKEFFNLDFIIVLNREVWLDSEFTDEKKLALVDHELCHADVALDDEGCRKRDERGRLVWRVRKHDIEEFHAIIQRHGCYKKDLEYFAQALLKRRNAPLFDREQGTVTITTGDGKEVFQGTDSQFSEAARKIAERARAN